MERPRRNAAEGIVRDLGLKILSGDIPPGEQLATEQALCERYAMSRTVIREALQALAAKGLTASRPRTGVIVLAPKRWNFLDADIIAWTEMLGERCRFFNEVMESRAILEPQIARLAARRADPADLEAIEAALVRMEEAAARADIQDYNAADLDFHMAMLEAARNVVLLRIGDLIRAALRTSFRLGTEGREISRESVRLHRSLFDAIRDGDGDAAAGHLERVAGILVERLNERAPRTVER
ncbi:FadR/GntR family transcriptional regulator [Inquilinus sp. CAU 1745]|uniref:FadR/GntR family transcriptional regulator n=1 Tax=Inquilinus sp. CAU 1745 TaxID=3140369 RepID=UPI00325AA7B2